MLGMFTDSGIQIRRGVPEDVWGAVRSLIEQDTNNPSSELAYQGMLSLERQPKRWVNVLLAAIDDALRMPMSPYIEHELKNQWLALLDLPLRARFSYGWRNAVGNFYQRGMTQALNEISYRPVSDGVDVWKMYNMGFVVKGGDKTVAFDLHPGWVFDQHLTREQLQQLATHVDALFITHRHADHYRPDVVRAFLAQDKPVIVSADAPMWGWPEGVTVLNADGRLTDIDGIRVTTHKGVQKFPRTGVNVYSVALNGVTMLHPGDNERLELYDSLTADQPVDLLFGNCWTGLEQSIARIRPKMVIAGHENEIRHPGHTCVPFTKSLHEFAKVRQLNEVPTPNMHALSWGQRLRVTPSSH